MICRLTERWFIRTQLTNSNLYKSLPDGTMTTLVLPSGYISYNGPLMDGKNMIYRVLKSYSSGYKWLVRLRDADDNITTLALNPFYGYISNPRPAYQINNGWIAYQEYNKEIDNWGLYVRSPEGETRPIFETPSQTWKQSWYARDWNHHQSVGRGRLGGIHGVLREVEILQNVPLFHSIG